MGRKKNDSNSVEITQDPPPLLLEDDVRCPICLFILVEPVTMPCNHSTCKTCFLSILKQATLQCPVCRGRVGNFARLSMKSGKLINTRLWSSIQKQFKKKLLLQQLDISTKESTESLAVNSAEPGEIQEEFERQMMLLCKADKLGNKARMEQEAQDERIAAALQCALNSPASVTRRQASEENSLGSTSSQHTLNTEANCSSSPDLRPGFCVPQNNVTAPCNEAGTERDSDEGGSSEGDHSSDRSTTRRLFQVNNNTSSSENEDSRQRRKTSKRKMSPGKENSRVPHKKTYSAQTKQFPGCSKRPRVAGTAELSVSYIDFSDEEISFPKAPKNCSKKLNIHTEKSKLKSTLGCSGDENRLKASTTNAIPAWVACARAGDPSTSEDEINFKGFTPTTSPSTHSSQKKKQKKSKQNPKNTQRNKDTKTRAKKATNNAHLTNLKKSSPSPTRSDGESGAASSRDSAAAADHVTDLLHGLPLSQLQDLPLDLHSNARLVEEQRAVEAQMKQEARDAKFAQRLQKQLTRMQVDRTIGSGEEYELRARKRPRNKSPVAFISNSKVTRDRSPCF